MKKGFTLIELLAVILVLGVIALIAIPIVTNMIDQAKKSALMDSAYGVIDAGELYYSVDLIKNTEGLSRYDFEIKNKKFVLSSDNTKVLKIKGSLPSTGTLQIYSDGKSAVALCNDAYCACKAVTEEKVSIKDNCNFDSETGDILGTSVTRSDLDEIQAQIDEINKPLVKVFDQSIRQSTVYNLTNMPEDVSKIKEIIMKINGFRYNYYILSENDLTSFAWHFSYFIENNFGQVLYAGYGNISLTAGTIRGSQLRRSGLGGNTSNSLDETVKFEIWVR